MKLESGTRFTIFCLRNGIHDSMNVPRWKYRCHVVKSVECCGYEIKLLMRIHTKNGGSFCEDRIWKSSTISSGLKLS